MTANEQFKFLKEKAIELAKEEGLPLKEMNRAPREHRGLCTSTGLIYIKMYTSPDMLEMVKLGRNATTVCHELAHLRHMHHEAEFWKYHKELCEKFSEKIRVKVIPGRSSRA